MPDRFVNFPSQLSNPFTDAVTVTKSDTVDLPDVSRGLFIPTAGAIRVTFMSGAVLTVSVPAGAQLPWRVTRVHATGTTATTVLALY